MTYACVAMRVANPCYMYYLWLNKFYSCYMAIVVIIIKGVALAMIHVIATKPIRVSYSAV